MISQLGSDERGKGKEEDEEEEDEEEGADVDDDADGGCCDEADAVEEVEDDEEEAAPGRACGIFSYILRSSSFPCGVSYSRIERRHILSAL